MSKTAVFLQNSKGGPKGKCSKIQKAKKIGNTSRRIAQLVWFETYTTLDFRYEKKRYERTLIRREMTIFPKSVDNRGFWQSTKGERKGKFSKMADFLGKLRKAKKISNTSRII